MTLSSMTGFARGHGVTGYYAWAWELSMFAGMMLQGFAFVPQITVPSVISPKELRVSGAVGSKA